MYTTIDGEKQDRATAALKAGIARQREYHMKMAGRMKDVIKADQEMNKAQNIEGALISIDPVTGEMLAYVGGYEFSAKNQNDHVAQIRRQPGSSFKPIVYAAAVEAKDITPSTVFVDDKATFKGGYMPRNYDGKYIGEVIVREALKKSINVVAVKILEKTGYDGVFGILKKALYLTDPEVKERFGRTLSLALGSYEVSPLENCVLHSVLVNGGAYVLPYGVKYVKDYNDNIVWNNEEEILKLVDERRKDAGTIIDPLACAVTVSMLRSVFEEGGTAAGSFKGSKIDFQVAGKTGSTTNYNDAWFVGYTSNIVTAVWIGNREGAISLGAGRSGGSVAAPVWVEYISGAYRGDRPGDFKMPEQGLALETICLDSGEVAGRNGECPRVARDIPFYSGTEPGQFCHLHTGKDKALEGENSAPVKEGAR